MKTSTARIVVGVSLVLSAMVVLARPQKFSNRTVTQPQPQYQQVQVQPQYQPVQVQPQYQPVQVQPPYQQGQVYPYYPSVQMQPRYQDVPVYPQYPSVQMQPRYQEVPVYPHYPSMQAQPWYHGGQAQPRHERVQAQAPQSSQYQSPKKPKGSVFVGELNAGGEAKEVAVNRVISQCYLEVVSGTVSINTVVIRPEKTALPQATRLTPGQLHIINLGGSRNVTGFRISDNGRGVYRVFVK